MLSKTPGDPNLKQALPKTPEVLDIQVSTWRAGALCTGYQVLPQRKLRCDLVLGFRLWGFRLEGFSEG